MSKIETVRNEMIRAMKAHDKETKESLSMLLQALQKTAKDKNKDLTEAEEDAVVLKEIKQCEETIASCPMERMDIIDFMLIRINLYKQFAPKQMTREEIYNELTSILTELKLTNPTKKDKGRIMKMLMPKVKGKADGKLVNAVVDDVLK